MEKIALQTAIAAFRHSKKAQRRPSRGTDVWSRYAHQSTYAQFHGDPARADFSHRLHGSNAARLLLKNVGEPGTAAMPGEWEKRHPQVPREVYTPRSLVSASTYRSEYQRGGVAERECFPESPRRALTPRSRCGADSRPWSSELSSRLGGSTNFSPRVPLHTIYNTSFRPPSVNSRGQDLA
eukprot:TRINITY_DN11360_c0_g1_i2.p1 TRINITY_DN11360_c0_g1~~TRINITY_DN11360_c0_g1_i2.p1  ORF type:complete len:181 (+),score=14.60 TRINITY_DN11360_c0_g1_i2:77-619(+)